MTGITPQKQIETQEATIKALWVDATKQAKRIEVLQGMVDWQSNRIAELEAQLTDKAIAERLFG